MNFRYALIKFGKKGTQLAVVIGETPTKYKCYRLNASNGCVEINSWIYPKGETTPVYQARKPSTFPKADLVEWVDETGFLHYGAWRCVQSTKRFTHKGYDEYRGLLLGQLAELHVRLD